MTDADLKKTLRLPDVVYTAYASFGHEGIGHASEPEPSLSGALDWAIEHDRWRILRVEMDPDNNLPIHVTDVTADAQELLDERMAR